MTSNNEQMVSGIEAFNCGIQKSLIHAGKHPIEYTDGTKVRKIYLNDISWLLL